MAFSRGLGVIGLVTVSWLVGVGCSDDDSTTQRDAEGGEAGESAAGAPTTAGKGGGGSGGTAGSTSGGTGGTTAGTAGDGGEPPIVSGGAGAGGDAPISGGAGAGGGGGEPPVATALQCSTECEVDDDCAVIGSIDTFTCDPTSKRCVTPLSAVVCGGPDDCVPPVNLWPTCQNTEDCGDSETFACVAWQGKGYCAYLAPACLPGDLELTLGEFGKVDSPVEVCVTTAACYKGSCSAGCEANGCASEGEGSGNGNTCSEVTHMCECAAGDECNSGACGEDHVCLQCQTNQDCVDSGAAGNDVCVDGRCGCSNAEVCPDNTASGTPVCE